MVYEPILHFTYVKYIKGDNSYMEPQFSSFENILDILRICNEKNLRTKKIIIEAKLKSIRRKVYKHNKCGNFDSNFVTFLITKK